MGGLIILLILIPVIFLILLISILNRTTSLQSMLDALYDEIKQLNKQLNKLSGQLNEKETPAKPLYKEPNDIKAASSSLIEKEESSKQASEEKPLPTTAQKETKEKTPEVFEMQEEEIKTPVTTKETKDWRNNWLEKNPDIEKFIGENLANKIGIAVLVLGIAFFVKYAIDKNWINETGRVIIGLASGALLIGLAHRFRNTYRSFSSVLVGGGLTVFYFTIAFAFHQYHLISQQTAFILMAVITAFAVILSLAYDRLELAVLATIGGFITPFLVNAGKENYIALFSYLCILNTGMIVLSWFKRWPIINTIALFFTMIIYGSWLISKTAFENTTSFPYQNAFLFASLFYFLFVTMTISNNLRLKRSFSAFDLLILLSVNFLYYVGGLVTLQYWNNGDYNGSFTASLGLINFVLAALFYRNKKIDRNFISLLIGLTLTFVSLAIPVQFKGNYVTIFWAAEAVVLLVLYQRSKIELLKIAYLIVMILMTASLLLNWFQIYFSDSRIIPVIINKGFVTSIVVAAATLITYRLLYKEGDSFFIKEITARRVRNFLLSFCVILFYLTGALEIYYQFNTRFPQIVLYSIYLQLYSFAFVLSLLRISKRLNNKSFPLLILTFSCLVIYLFNLHNNYDVSFEIVRTGNNKPYFIAHWLAGILLLKLLGDFIILSKKDRDAETYNLPVFIWAASAGIFLILSIEMYHVLLWTNYGTDWAYWENLYYKAGLTILWSVCSFIAMWLGMKYHFRVLRIISLTLFTITLIKLFVYDISNIPPGGKIAAFVLLGVLLLTVSFMYQRLKKIIIEDSPPENKN